MKKRVGVSLVVCLSVLLFGLALAAEKAKPSVNYPAGYRNWSHVKSMVIQQGHKVFEMFGGIHHIYANKKAFEALTKGTPYRDGAVFVFDLLEATSADNAITEGPRKFIGVIQKDSTKFAETGGWGFEGFKGDTKERMVKDPKACFKCHEPKKDSGYVISKYRK
ncbi:MAG: cytochrome P460 family protein [Deltaproteobacteria bacterium]